MLLRSLPTKSRKKWVCDVFNTFATHGGLLRDVTDTVCYAQNGSTLGRLFKTIKRRCLTNRSRNRAKNCCVSVVL